MSLRARLVTLTPLVTLTRTMVTRRPPVTLTQYLTLNRPRHQSTVQRQSAITVKHHLSAVTVQRHPSTVTVQRHLSANTVQRHLSTSPRITVQPSSLVDDVISLRVEGCPPHAPVTLHAYVKEGRIKYTSCGHFVTDGSGAVDASRGRSSGGTYEGVDGMGLIWSMEAGPGETWGRRLIKVDVTTPLDTVFSVMEGHLTREQCLDKFDRKAYLAQTSCQRWYMSDDVTRIPVRLGPLRGTYFRPAGPGPHPAVVDLFGLIGGLVEFRAALLASRGIASLCVAYFNYDDLPPTLDRLDVDYFRHAVEYLQSRDEVNQTKGIGVVGISLGGQVAALMATYLPQITVCVMINSGVHCLLVSPYYQGFLGGHMTSLEDMLELGERKEDGTIDCRGISLPIIDENRIKVESSKAKFLLLAARDDGCIHPEAMDDVTLYLARGQYDLVSLPGAGHFLEPPYSPLNPVIQCPTGKMASGGNKREHNDAQILAWRKMLEFLHTNLGP